jgi:hypothetical protein
MSIYIVVSQTTRLAAVWTRNTLTKQLLLSASIIAYSLLLIERNKKINKYYDRDPDELPTNSSNQNSKVS